MLLGENIQKFRREQNLSQEELAEKCNVSRQAVTKWENGESAPSIDKLVLLADILSVSTDELLGRVEKNTYDRLKDIVKQISKDDIVVTDDELVAMISRFIQFSSEMNISSEDTIRGMQEIFLQDSEE